MSEGQAVVDGRTRRAFDLHWPLGLYVAVRFCLTFGRILSKILAKQ